MTGPWPPNLKEDRSLKEDRDEAGELGGRPGMRLDSWDGSVLTKEGNDPRPEGRDERRVEGNDWAMAAKPEGRPEPEGRPGMRLDSWDGSRG